MSLVIILDNCSKIISVYIKIFKPERRNNGTFRVPAWKKCVPGHF